MLTFGTFCYHKKSENVKKSCYWMENYSGKFEWVDADPVYQEVLTKKQCFEFDSCDGGLDYSGGGCYKWTYSRNGKRESWDDVKYTDESEQNAE